MMEIKETQSSNPPPLLHEYGARRYVTVRVRESTVDGVLFYNFIKLPLEHPLRVKNVESTVTSFYLKEIEEAGKRCVDAVRSTLLGTSTEYDEALLFDVEFEVDSLRAELAEILQAVQVI